MKIRYYGHVGQLSGYGRAASDLCMSLLAAGLELEINPVGQVTPQEAALALERYEPLQACLRHVQDLTKPDVIIVHTLPMDCVKVMNIELARDPALDPDIPWIAYTTWEGLSSAPRDMVGALEEFEGLWVPSSLTARAFAAWSKGELDKVTVVPHAFDPDSTAARTIPRTDRERFTFLYVGAWNSRKNPMGLLRAWAMAFSDGDPVQLIVHSPGTPQEAFAVAMTQTGLPPASMAKAELSANPLTEDQMWLLYAEADCFVTATRGEAWNLPAFEAVLAGRHVISPAGLGSDDFLRDTSADLYGGMAMPATVDVRVTERMADGSGVRLQIVGAQGLSSRSTWLEPDLVRLAETMRNVYLAKRHTRRGITLNYDPVERYGYPAVGKIATTALENLL